MIFILVLEVVDLPPDITAAQLKTEFAFWKLPYPATPETESDLPKEETAEDIDVSEDDFSRMTIDEKFQCAKKMILYQDSDILIKGVSFMLDVLEEQTDEKLRVEAMHHISFGYYRLGNVAKARLFSQKTLEADPNHHSKEILVLANDAGFSYAKAGVLFLGVVGAVSMILWSLAPKGQKRR